MWQWDRLLQWRLEQRQQQPVVPRQPVPRVPPRRQVVPTTNSHTKAWLWHQQQAPPRVVPKTNNHRKPERLEPELVQALELPNFQKEVGCRRPGRAASSTVGLLGLPVET